MGKTYNTYTLGDRRQPYVMYAKVAQMATTRKVWAMGLCGGFNAMAARPDFGIKRRVKSPWVSTRRPEHDFGT